MPGLDVSAVSSNWKKLQDKLKSDKPSTKTTASSGLKRGRNDDKTNGNSSKRPRLSSQNSNYIPVKSLNRRKMGSAFSAQQATADSPSNSRRSTLVATHDITSADLSAAYGSTSNANRTNSISDPTDEINAGLHPSHKAGRYLALDCEMVGAGPPPHADNVLARVSLVNFHGQQIYDSFVQPPAGIKVQDYRTFVSGIQPHHMTETYARPFGEVQKTVSKLLSGRVLVGHAVKNDLEVLVLPHPKRDVRDTSRYAPFRIDSRGKPPALRNLAKSVLGLTIQTGAHSSVEDARATMALYKKEKVGFEAENRKRFGQGRAPTMVGKNVDGGSEDEDEDDEEYDEDEDLDLLDGEDDGADEVRPKASRGAAGGAKKKKGKKKKKRTKHA